MSNEKEKTAVGKFLSGGLVKKILVPIIRGSIKSVPFVGTPIAEVLTNFTQSNTKPATSTEGQQVEVYTGNKHNYVSIIVQVTIGVCLILDLTMNKGANLKAILDMVGILPK